MYIPTAPRPTLSSAQQDSQNVIDELVAQYRNNKQQQKLGPAAELISWVKDNIDDDRLRDALSEHAESDRADLYKKIMSICINENVNDEEVWDKIFRAWDAIPSNDQAPVLYDIVQVLGAPKPGQEHLWHWVWREGKKIDLPFNSGALLLKITNTLVANEKYGLLDKIMDSELERIDYAERYFSPEEHPLNPSKVGTSFWSDLLNMVRQIPKQDTFLLSILNSVGTLLNKLEIDNSAVWKELSTILTSITKMDTENIERLIKIGRQYLKDPEFWMWIMEFIPSIDIHQRYGIANELASCMGSAAVKNPKAWTKMLDVLNAMPAELANSIQHKELLGKIIVNMGRTLVTSPSLWNKVINEMSVDTDSWHSTEDWELKELTSQMYTAKVTNPDLSFGLIKLHAAALFLHLQEHSGVNCRSIMMEIKECKDVSTLMNWLLNQVLPDDEKSQLLKQISRSMGHAIDDMGLWTLVITHQVQAISKATPCPDFVALKYHVTNLCAHYEMAGQTFKLMLQNAIESGRWQLSNFEQVRQYRKEVKLAAPDFPWEKLFIAKKKLAEQEFCTFPDLANVGHAFVKSIQSLTNLVKQLPQQKRLPFHFITLLNGTLATRLQQGKSDRQQTKVNREGLAYLIKMNQGQAAIHHSVIDAITQIRALKMDEDELKTACDNVWKCYQQLAELVNIEDFNDRYSRCDFYTCEVLDKEAASALVLGNAVSCCLATDGGSFAPEMINRLTHPSWVPVVVRDYKNDYVAAAWCAITYDKDSEQILLVEDFADIATRFSQKEMVHGYEIENRSGNHIMKELHKYIWNLAKHLELEHRPLIGKQARGRMEKFDAFAKSIDAYFLKPKLTFLCNERSTGDNIQHLGVVGQFF